MNAPASRPQRPEQTPDAQTEHMAQARDALGADFHGADALDTDPRAWLSALADGDDAAVQQASHAWRNDAQARADWHTYHLIGDVLRSDDLAVDPAHDAQFVARLRQRLADEPVPLAPAPQLAPARAALRRRRAAWLMPVAAAAGVAAVAAVLVLTQADLQTAAPTGGWAFNAPATDAAGTQTRPGQGDRVANANANANAPGATGNANARLLRDARLDHYLEAHRGALGTAVAVPGGAMRNAEVIVPAPAQR